MDRIAPESYAHSCQLGRNGGEGKMPWKEFFIYLFLLLAVKRGTCHPCLKIFRVGKAKEGLTYYTYLHIRFWGRKRALCLSRAGGKEGNVHTGRLVLLNNLTTYSTLSASTMMVSGCLTTRKQYQCCVHHITHLRKLNLIEKKKKKSSVSGWNILEVFIYEKCLSLWWCGLLQSYASWLVAIQFPVIVTATLLEILRYSTHKATQRRRGKDYSCFLKL